MLPPLPLQMSLFGIPLSNVLQLRSQLLGAGSLLSAERFLFEQVGATYLIRSADGGGVAITPVSNVDVQLALKRQGSGSIDGGGGGGAAAATTMAAAGAAGQMKGAARAPAGGGGFAAGVQRSLEGWLYHHHGSYAQELQTAALINYRRSVHRPRP